MLSQNPEPKSKYSENNIFMTSLFGTLLLGAPSLSVTPLVGIRLIYTKYFKLLARTVSTGSPARDFLQPTRLALVGYFQGAPDLFRKMTS